MPSLCTKSPSSESTKPAELSPKAAPLASLFSQSPEDLAELCRGWGLPKFRIEQLQNWIFRDRVFELSAMSNLPKVLRQRLSETFSLDLSQIVSRLDSEDGASKLLLRTAGGQQM